MKLHTMPTAFWGRLLIVLTALTWLSVSAQAGDALLPPQQVIQSTTSLLQQTLQKDEYKADFQKAVRFVDQTIDPHSDFNRISALVLGKYWKTATDAQKTRFRQEFKTLLIRTYATAFTEYANWTIRYLPLSMAPGEDKVMVKTEILQAGAPPSAVDYRMINIGGTWKVYDVLIEGVSLLQNYRTSFGQEIAQNNDLDGVINRLAERNNVALRQPVKEDLKAGGKN